MYGWELYTAAQLPSHKYVHCARWFHLYPGYFGFSFLQWEEAMCHPFLVGVQTSPCKLRKQKCLSVKRSGSLGAYTMYVQQLYMACDTHFNYLFFFLSLSQQLEMEDEDTIDVFQQQTGGLI